jgi:predicted Fe-Mo cluster-binding NifX family protein
MSKQFILQAAKSKWQTAKRRISMKVAVAARGNQVDDHFGHCEHFMVFTIGDDKNIQSEVKIDSPEGCGCKSGIAQELSAQGVTYMLAGNMGTGAVSKLASSGIHVVRGCTGDVHSAVKAFVAGTLLDDGKSCSAHGGHEGCEHH